MTQEMVPLLSHQGKNEWIRDAMVEIVDTTVGLTIALVTHVVIEAAVEAVREVEGEEIEGDLQAMKKQRNTLNSRIRLTPKNAYCNLRTL